MKKILSIMACVMGILTLTPSTHAAYQRSIMGYDSRGNPIIRVIWVADHLDYPRFYYDRRTYPTSGRRNWTPLNTPSSYTPTYSAYDAYYSR